MTSNYGSIIVSWDFSNGNDKGILLVGKKDAGKPIDVINAFQGKEAYDIYEKLITRKATDAK